MRIKAELCDLDGRPFAQRQEPPALLHSSLHITQTGDEFLILDHEYFEMWLTLALTSLLAVLILASQKAPLYLALTSVPTVK